MDQRAFERTYVGNCNGTVFGGCKVMLVNVTHELLVELIFKFLFIKGMFESCSVFLPFEELLPWVETSDFLFRKRLGPVLDFRQRIAALKIVSFFKLRMRFFNFSRMSYGNNPSFIMMSGSLTNIQGKTLGKRIIRVPFLQSGAENQCENHSVSVLPLLTWVHEKALNPLIRHANIKPRGMFEWSCSLITSMVLLKNRREGLHYVMTSQPRRSLWHLRIFGSKRLFAFFNEA